MLRTSSAHYPALHALYLSHNTYFPLIAAVLSGEQDGVVFVDNEISPAQVYVEHSFGFAQFFGKPSRVFEHSLQNYLLVDKLFSCNKVRLYTPHCPDFLRSPEHMNLRSWRQHFQLDTSRFIAPEVPKLKGLTLTHVDKNCVDMIEDAFGVVGYFWRSASDFAHKSNGVLALVDGRAAALCYAAAKVDGKAEIDVLTLPAYRQMGLAKTVVSLFNQYCLAQKVLPLWDCFTNNTASMALCQSAGFIPLGEPYPFFTFNR